ncbi:hypothetical protein AB4354_02825 [Vibrio splendidus]|uniref:hypothetical protein n=1 Tax=Vibrio splendidus TaxID=29497 RepID=UPI0013000132|nr:hypothetical protein [Vibrio splendidus]
MAAKTSLIASKAFEVTCYEGIYSVVSEIPEREVFEIHYDEGRYFEIGGMCSQMSDSFR